MAGEAVDDVYLGLSEPPKILLASCSLTPGGAASGGTQL